MNMSSGNHFLANRYCSSMNGIGVTGDQMMPLLQLPAFGNAPVGASVGQPFFAFDIGGGKRNTCRVEPVAIFVDQALATYGLQKLTGNSDRFYLTCLFIFNLLQTADPAAIAQGFPLLPGHLVQCCGHPERILLLFHHLKNLTFLSLRAPPESALSISCRTI